MSAATSLTMIATLLLLALTAVAAAWRTARRIGTWRHPHVAAQPMAALLLGLLLFPPSAPSLGDALSVYTANASPSAWRRLWWPRLEVALPESHADAGTERAPDLATALRRHPAVTAVRIEGDGLALRDQSAARGLRLRFDAAKDGTDAANAARSVDAGRPALLELEAPQQVQVGTQWQLEGRASAWARRVELRDPAGAVVDAAKTEQGRFRLSASARAAGPLRFELRLLGDRQQVLETASVPLLARAGEPMTAIVRAGTPDPELKYWRRWATDAGITVRLAAGLSDGIALRDGDASLTPASLATADLLIIDDRAWGALSRAEVAAVQTAVSQGLGLLLRSTEAPDATVAADWARLGWRFEPGTEPHPVSLDRRTGLHPDALGEHIEFTAGSVKAVATTDIDSASTVLLRSDDGEPLAAVRDLGRGRVGIWRLQDSYRLQLAGEGARYASLWVEVLSQLARPRTRSESIASAGDTWVDERIVWCDLGRGAAVTPPGGSAVPLDVDAAGCAAYWPGRPGWHRRVATVNVSDAASASATAAAPFYVRAHDDGASLRTARDRGATEALAQSPPSEKRISVPGEPAPDMPAPRLPRWPFFLAWLAVMGWVMVKERWNERRNEQVQAR